MKLKKLNGVKQNKKIAQINVFVSDEKLSWAQAVNGFYVLVFQSELDALIQNRDVTLSDLRVLFYLIAHVDNSNCITVTVKDISIELHLSHVSVYRALATLINMQLICERADRRNGRKYELTTKLVNPRLAFWGTSTKLNKNATPPILAPDGLTPLLPDSFCRDSIAYSLSFGSYCADNEIDEQK